MENGWDYLKDRKTLQSLMSTLENVVSSGKSNFCLYGYISLSVETCNQIYSLNDWLREILDSWLKDYNWILKASPSTEPSEVVFLALFVIE